MLKTIEKHEYMNITRIMIAFVVGETGDSGDCTRRERGIR